MNAELKEAFSRIKPVCDLVMVCPTADSIAGFLVRVSEIKVEALQELQQYVLFPFITHIKSEEMEKNFEMQCKMADAMRTVLEKVTVNSFEMCMKIETALLSLVFDNSKPGMVAAVPEELKLSVMRCLTALQLRLDVASRASLLRTQVPTIAQAVFVSVHIAKLEKLRALRLAAIDCLTSHTATHAQLTDEKCHIADPALCALAVDTLANILPGVLAALQDVATDADNPGHAVVVAALAAMHRVVCVALAEAHMPAPRPPAAADFARRLAHHTQPDQVSNEKKQKLLPKRSLEWYEMAGEKIAVVTRSVVPLSVHPHPRVRRELAVLCYRILDECSRSMQPSVPIALDVLISLSNDEWPEVRQYCAAAVRRCLTAPLALDGLADNLMAIFNSLPRILNNIDASRKLAALNLLHGYIEMMCSGRPQRLSTVCCAPGNMQAACDSLLNAASVLPLTSLAQHADRDVTTPPPTNSPWCKLRHLDSAACENRLQEILRLLGAAECTELIADRLFELFQQSRDAEIVYIVNWMVSAPKSPLSLASRVINTYTEETVWYSPLEVGSAEAPVTSAETADLTVYNPRAWSKDSVPDLYEGTVETRYTDISYQKPRTQPHRDPNTCATLAEAQRNMVLSCLLTEGVGICATRMKEQYQPFLLKTLCLILERVGSKYEMLHLAGLKAMNDIALACGHKTVAELIQHNADYFTNQVTLRLKKAWNSNSALQILSVVMEYSDASILDCLYGIVEDVLVQSCDKYHERNLEAYLQVFLTFIQCIRKWFPVQQTDKPSENPTDTEPDLLNDVREFSKNHQESERLMSQEDFEKESGMSVEEMYREDVKKREDLLDYDDRVTEEKQPPPQHIKVTITILKRCINFVSSRHRNESLLSLQVLTTGFPLLDLYEDELLPLVHYAWGPLVGRFDEKDPVILKRALELLVVLAELSRDFIRSRAVKEVLPNIYKYLRRSSQDSYLKDAGSAYRNSQAFSLQGAALAALAGLVVDLMLDDERVAEAMDCAALYLSNKQPKPLQALAVQFFKILLKCEYGATWHYLRKLCNNDVTVQPPQTALQLKPVVGTPYDASNKDYVNNIKLIWDKDSVE